jgi:hypothetical protein
MFAIVLRFMTRPTKWSDICTIDGCHHPDTGGALQRRLTIDLWLALMLNSRIETVSLT